jgi:hypothetical protein
MHLYRRVHWADGANIAATAENLSKNRPPTEPHITGFYPALIGGLFSDAALDFKKRLLHPNQTVNDAIAEKSYFALNGAMDRHEIRP